jgi:DNA-binding NtrC family response regulator
MTVLITLHDVERAVRLNAQLEREGLKTEMVSPLDDMRGAIKRVRPDVIVATGELTDRLTESIVQEQLWAGVPSIGLADTSDERVLERLRSIGYVELYVKPVDATELAAAVKRLLERRRLQRETGLIGESEALREVLVKIEQMAPVSSTVLIEGESGTGKELVARALHRLSGRRNKPFIAESVGALPETLLESELFGHEKGAFTGAAERRIGRFELADTGTLFLDEVGEIPIATQVKLLRVLEQREFLRVGGTAAIRVDVRVITATNRPLRQLVDEGTFRADLFYRLNVLNIHLPPLRERREDVPHLVRKFITDYSAEHDREFHGISADAMKLLVEYPWPGNVRELRNLVESMVVLSPGREIQPDDLPRQIREGGSARWLPVPVGQVVRGQEAARDGGGRELEFILRSLLELRLQVEDLRRQMQNGEGGGRRLEAGGDFIGEVYPPTGPAGLPITAARIAPRDAAPPPNIVTIPPGTKMPDIERQVIEAALKETRGNRRRAAEMLGIGERTLYRKIKEYKVPEELFVTTE